MTQIKSKICLVGEKGVGKTSLIRRFVQNAFDDRYLATIGTKVTKKEMQIVSEREDLVVDIDMAIWDIMGEKGFRELLKDSYFYGANAILAVADVTRKATLEDLDDWIDGVFRVAGRIPVVLAINKADLAGQREVEGKDVEQFAAAFDAKFLHTSAKTGAGVQQALRILADLVVHHQLSLGTEAAAAPM